MSDDERKKRHIIRGWAGRTWSTARVGASLGRAAARKVVDHALERDPAEAGFDADAMVERMDQLKGLVMKLGQMVSYLDGAIPESGQRVLRKLQRDAQPMEPEIVREAVRESLGADPEALFDRFDPVPFAAASIGQVHRAERGGRALAVKVQYPEIAKALQIDFSNLKRAGFLATFGTAFDHRSMLAELEARVTEECQYRLEAARQEWFRERLAGDPDVFVPAIVADRCGERVITSELVEGKGFYDFVETATQQQKSRAGLALYRVVYRCIFGLSAFNGDPHPGNYVFAEDGRIALLDFGCVRFFEAAQIERWKAMARAVLADDRAGFFREFYASGFTSGSYDEDHQWQVMQYLYRPMKEPRFRFTHDYVRESYALFFWENPNLRKTRMPAEWVVANRLQWGLNSVLAHLSAEGDFVTPFADALALPTVSLEPPIALSA